MEKKFPHDLKDIDPNLHDSGFLDDESLDDKERDISDLFNKENNNNNNNLISKDNIKKEKEEKISKLDYQNQKLSSQLHNKTANIKGNILLNKQSKDNINMGNSFNTETAENEKYRNILEKLNDSKKRNIHLLNQVKMLKEKLNE